VVESDNLDDILPGEDPEPNASEEAESTDQSDTSSAPDPTVNVVIEDQIPVEVA